MIGAKFISIVIGWTGNTDFVLVETIGWESMKTSATGKAAKIRCSETHLSTSVT
jgi:hypothetical protein